MSDQRISMIIGAGVPLNFDLPDNINKPSTDNITKEVIKPYKIYSGTGAYKQTDII